MKIPVIDKYHPRFTWWKRKALRTFIYKYKGFSHSTPKPYLLADHRRHCKRMNRRLANWNFD